MDIRRVLSALDTVNSNINVIKSEIISNGIEEFTNGLIVDGGPKRFENIKVTSNSDQSAIKIGNNDNQKTINSAPDYIVLNKVWVPTFGGKRAIEIHAQNVQLRDVNLLDISDKSGGTRDSQGIWIGNSPGNIVVLDGNIEAASENILIGGATIMIPNMRPDTFLFQSLTLTKNQTWRGTAGIPIKNLFELKDGHNVTVVDCSLAHCWKSGQDGWAFMITPALGGSLRNIKIKQCNVMDVAGIVNITGVDAAGINKERTTFEMDGGKYTCSKKDNGGRGIFCLITRGPESVEFRNLEASFDGDQFIYVGDDQVIDRLVVENCKFNNYGLYGLMINGQAHGNNPLGIIKSLVIQNNTFPISSPTAFKTRFPNNIYA